MLLTAILITYVGVGSGIYEYLKTGDEESALLFGVVAFISTWALYAFLLFNVQQ
jgi:hypothetical protein